MTQEQVDRIGMACFKAMVFFTLATMALGFTAVLYQMGIVSWK